MGVGYQQQSLALTDPIGDRTEQDIQRRKRIAQTLMQQGMDASPVQHWLQGAARMAQGVVGGMNESMAARDQKALDDHQAAARNAASAKQQFLDKEAASIYGGLVPQTGIMGMDANAIQQMLQNPQTRDEAQGIIMKGRMADWQRNQTPTEAERLDLEMKRVQIAKMQAEAAGGGDVPSNIKEWNAFKAMTPDQQQQYLVMKRSIPYLDTGTGYTQPNAADPTAAPRVIPKDIAGAEAQKVYGRETAEGQMQLPKTATALQQYEATDQVVNKAIDDAAMLASKDMTTGLAGGVMRNVPGSNAYDLKARLAPIKANLGFDKLQNIRDNSPTGGALGQVAVQELEMLQSTFASLDQAQSQEQFVAGLNEIKGIRAKFKELKRQAYERDVARFGAGNVPNPGTGARQPQGVGPGRSAAPPTAPRNNGWSIERLD